LNRLATPLSLFILIFVIKQMDLTQITQSSLFGLLGSLRNVVTNSFVSFIGFITILGPIANNKGHTRRTAQLVEEIQRNENNKSVVEGEREEGDCFEFRNLVCVTPSGRELNQPGLTAKITRSDRLVLMGPSGSGKSSLLRVLARLWTFSSGKIIQPPKASVFFVPQKPYMVLGTLRDQILYPHTVTRNEVPPDSKLTEYLEMVNLTYLLERYDYDDIAIWNYVLSPGEQQRLSFARLFYHAPDFAVLDESTNALDPNNEYDMYMQCTKLNIALISVGHKESLLAYHNLLLVYDGKGGWELKRAVPQEEENTRGVVIDTIVDDVPDGDLN